MAYDLWSVCKKVIPMLCAMFIYKTKGGYTFSAFLVFSANLCLETVLIIPNYRNGWNWLNYYKMQSTELIARILQRDSTVGLNTD